MREIKFRAMLSGMKFLSAPFDWYDLRLMPQAEFIVQGTGIKDKNGKEIYEGDIVKGYYQEVEFDKDILAEVEYENGGFSVEGYHLSRVEYIEVIGNIYENGNLLNN